MNAKFSGALGLRTVKCEHCGLPLPLREPRTSFEARSWRCNGCGQEVKGQLHPDYRLEELRNLCPEPIHFDRSQIPPPSSELLQTATRLRLAPGHDGREKRQSQRFPVTAIVPVLPLDALLQPIGTPFMLVARNISAGGICLLHDHAITSEFLALEFAAPGGNLVQVLVQITRSRPRGNVYEIGGEFVSKMAPPTQSAPT